MVSEIQKAWKLFQDGKFIDALSIAEILSNSENGDSESTYLQGCCLSQLGRYADAFSSFEQSLLYEPGATHVYMAMATLLLAQGNLDGAANYYNKVLYGDPSHLHARVGLAKAQAASGKYDDAQKQLQISQEYSPDSGLPHYTLGVIGRQTNIPINDIYQHLLTAASFEPEIAEYQLALGECLLNQDRYDDAKSCLYKAHLIDPDNPYVLGRLAAVSVKQGAMDFAYEQIDKLQKRKLYMPDVAITFLLCCKHANCCDEAIEYAQICLSDTTICADDRRNIHSKLASVLDNMQQYDLAWKHLVASKEGTALHEKYEPTGYKKYIDSLVETFHFASMFNLPRANIKHKTLPIFIIGMPRSGTSLVEQILAAHPEVTGGGELTYMPSIIDGLSKKAGSSRPWPFCALDAGQQTINSAAQYYLDNIDRLSDNTQYVTDKMPHNFYSLGLIRLLFPEAKVIHCTRDPLDTCLSIYFQKFKEGHPYSKNLFHLGTHYHQYQRLMEHWKTSLSYNMFEIKYENLVQSPEESISKMLDYCGLDWNDNCLNFNKVKRYVLTASFDQVRQPLHTRSVNRWQHYDQYLDDLKEGFKRGF